ncbi:cyclopropane-fatty-acyl-phospholipid synthase [Daldinia caldariorum]|uniref:cyclopropane-fatty-acyl-phospholipid synthase n=1 Tax=Daldinia caldariorum TaxID=326644 RepID=UPI002007E151|nr:cyclopropane-fatty-acyl-phospholipid synthase [Daldinia caldariorum]KAI1463046.1 cyclopropane-fatty-acyl-phospholipid synthase [Daldinia caldariorum]
MVPPIPSIIARPLTQGADLIRGTLGSLTWGPALAIAKPAVLSVFSEIEVGTLLLVDEPEGTEMVYGQRPASKESLPVNWGIPPRKANATPRVEIRVKDSAFWMRLLLFADMGFAESYMLGEFECADLTAFFQLFIANRDQLSNGTTIFSSISGAVSSIARTTNTLSNALLNASAHYDISNDMFAAFLSKDMTYSCPIWQTRITHNDPEETLEEAQMTKLRRFIDGTKIKPTDHVLEIGTGWGSFALEAVRKTGCRVTSLTLSKEQKRLAEQRIDEAGYSGRIDVQLMDYRSLPGTAVFDKIISIEMLENVGMGYIGTYFACIDRLLKKKGGIAMFQCITMPEGRHEAYSKSEDVINKHIFPGGYLPSTMQLLDSISQQSKGTLIVERVENIGGHYAKTLRLWRENFLSNFESKIRPALKAEHPHMTAQEVDVFRRKWEYYFAYCEAGFVTKSLGDVIITVGREGTMELMEGIPL